MKPKNVIIAIGTLLIVASVAFLAYWFGFLRTDELTTGERVVVNQDSGSSNQSETDVGESESSSSDNQTDQQEVPYEVEVVAENLFVPWSIVFPSEDRILLTERNGRIRAIEDGVLREAPLKVFTEISTQAEEGLMGMALHPDYEENKYVYVCLAYPKNGGLVDKVVRLKDKGNEISEEEIILDDIPAARFHAGCEIKFGPDGKLYITTGDATNGDISQDLDSLGGKILRINPDGTFPEDGPFRDWIIYSYGHRNPQGIDWHPVTGTMFSTEHGPSGFDGPPGGDEVNIIKPGNNYGWPLVSHEMTQVGLESPLLVFTPAEAPGSAMFYTSDVLPQFTNNFFFGALRGEGIVRVVFSDRNPEEVEFYEKLDIGDLGRIREVAEGPDGAIYFSTSNQDGRGTVRDGDDKIYRIVGGL